MAQSLCLLSFLCHQGKIPYCFLLCGAQDQCGSLPYSNWQRGLQSSPYSVQADLEALFLSWLSRLGQSRRDRRRNSVGILCTENSNTRVLSAHRESVPVRRQPYRAS